MEIIFNWFLCKENGSVKVVIRFFITPPGKCAYHIVKAIRKLAVNKKKMVYDGYQRIINFD